MERILQLPPFPRTLNNVFVATSKHGLVGSTPGKMVTGGLKRPGGRGALIAGGGAPLPNFCKRQWEDTVAVCTTEQVLSPPFYPTSLPDHLLLLPSVLFPESNLVDRLPPSSSLFLLSSTEVRFEEERERRKEGRSQTGQIGHTRRRTDPPTVAHSLSPLSSPSLLPVLSNCLPDGKGKGKRETGL